MSLTRLRSLRNTALFGWLLLFVVARGMLAPGFMPAFGNDGLSIKLCTPQGAETVWLGGEQSAEAHGSLDCPFGVSLGLAALPATAAAFDLARGQESPQAASALVVSPVFVAAYRARGPPASS